MNNEDCSTIISVLGMMGLLAYSISNEIHKKNVEEQCKDPIVLEVQDINKDGLEDRIYSNSKGVYQVQYGSIVNDSLVYLTKEQLADNLEQKYNINTTE